MSLYGVPFLLTHLGAQTVYVIDQRLRDQKIPEQKAQRIVCDICAILFSENLWNQISSPQEMYTSESTRSVVEKIVHSSLIKLNAASMTKLYDLTQMVFKHQLLCCTRPSELWTLTKSHLATINSLVPQLEKLKEYTKFVRRFTGLAESLTATDWLSLRQTLLEFLRDKQVKITILMNARYQAQGGNLSCLSQPSCVASVGSVVINRIQVLKEGQKRVSTGDLALPAYARKDLLFGPKELLCNIYGQEGSYAPKSPMSSPKASPRLAPQSPSSYHRGALAEPAEREHHVLSPASSIDGGKELNSLAEMIGARRVAAPTPSKLSIFADSIDVDEQDDDYTPDPNVVVKLVEDFVLEAKNMNVSRQSLEKVVGDLDLGVEDSAPADGGDDLLDLMDEL